MSWKHVILIPCILGVAFVATSTVTPEEVQEKLATYADYLKKGRLEYTVQIPIYWLILLQEAELVKSNLSNEFVSYSNSFDDFINITSLDEEAYECVNSVMSEFNEYNEAILNNIDTFLQEMKIYLNDFLSTLDTGAIDLEALSESINACNDSVCAEELNEALNLSESNLGSTVRAMGTNLDELENKITDYSLDNAYSEEIDQLKQKAADCLSL